MHELVPEKRKTLLYETGREGQFDTEGAELLHPVLHISFDDGCNEIFINGGSASHDFLIISRSLIGRDDRTLILQGYLGIRNK